jgi:hypothetical protein
VKAISGRFSALLVRPAPGRALTAASWDRAGLFRRGRPSSPSSRVGAASSSSPASSSSSSSSPCSSLSYASTTFYGNLSAGSIAVGVTSHCDTEKLGLPPSTATSVTILMVRDCDWTFFSIFSFSP